jgi:hypothetical protein
VRKLITTLLITSVAFPATASALPYTGYQDLRNPDTRGDAIAAERAQYQDLRNPDTRGDAIAAERGVKPAAVARVARVDRAGEPDGFDWGDAGIGASAMLGLLAVAGGVLVLAGTQRRPLA